MHGAAETQDCKPKSHLAIDKLFGITKRHFFTSRVTRLVDLVLRKNRKAVARLALYLAPAVRGASKPRDQRVVLITAPPDYAEHPAACLLARKRADIAIALSIRSS